MEQVDVVDTNCTILYQTSKQKAHEKGLLHKCVIAEIINSKGEWVLVEPSSHKQDAGQFVSPIGGHVSAGERDEDALIREAFEETQINQFTHKFVGRNIFDRKVLGRHENHYFMVYELYTDQEIILSDEGKSFRHFTRNEIRDIYKTAPERFGDAFLHVLRSFYPDIVK